MQYLSFLISLYLNWFSLNCLYILIIFDNANNLFSNIKYLISIAHTNLFCYFEEKTDFNRVCIYICVQKSISAKKKFINYKSNVYI